MINDYIRKQDASDAVIKHLQLDYEYAWGAREAINALPSADVVPVVHGHWIPYRCDMYECSVCKRIYTSFDSERCDANYCPHCGSFNGGKNEV